MNTKRIGGLAALAASILAMGPACAETLHMKAMLDGASEVPANTTKGTGGVEVTYDASSRALAWTGTYTGLTGPATAAHFHGPAEPGKNADVIVPAPAPASPFKGSATLTEAQAKELTDGKVYFNVHTAEHKGGEIRGQVMKTP